MPKTVICDVCGKKGFEDEDWGCVCEYHYLTNEVRYLKEQYEAERDWVIDCWISKLKEMRREIRETEEKIKELEKTQ
jgi:hypothetical protein